MRISDWSADVCSSDLAILRPHDGHGDGDPALRAHPGRGGAAGPGELLLRPALLPRPPDPPAGGLRQHGRGRGAAPIRRRLTEERCVGKESASTSRPTLTSYT